MVELGPLLVRGEGAAELKARVLECEPAPGVARHVELSAAGSGCQSVQVEGSAWVVVALWLCGVV